MSELKLDRTGLQSLVLGGNVFGWTLDEKASFEILDAYLDHGFSAIDTANIYSTWVPGNDGSESEKIIGNWMKERGNRDKVTLITKVGGPKAGKGLDVSPQAIASESEISLNHLRTDFIDIYFNHFDDEVTPIAETLQAFQKLKEEGKIGVIGASNISKERLEESLKTSKENGLISYQILQPEYNLYDREGFEKGAKELTEAYGLAVIPYYSLASGFLSGKYQSPEDFDKYPRGGGVKQRYDNPRGAKILQALKEVAEDNQSKMSVVALAFLLAQPFITAPVASATKISHIKDFALARDLQLSEADLNKLLEASAY